MTQTDRLAPEGAAGASAALALSVAGVVPEGDASPRLRYRGVGDGYDDARAVTGRVVAVGDGVKLRFQLPAASVDFILLEPAAVAGSYRIPHMVWAGKVVADLRRRVMAVDGRVDDRGNRGGLRIVNERGRPTVEFDVRDLASGADGQCIELVLQRDAEGAAAADAIALLADRLSVDQAAGHAGIARVGRELATASDRIGDVIAGQAQLAARVDQIAVRGDGLEQRLVALEGAIGGCAGEQSLAGLKVFVEQAVADRFAAEAAAAAGRDALARDLEGIRQALGELQAQAQRVTHAVENVFWRRWLRRLRGGGR